MASEVFEGVLEGLQEMKEYIETGVLPDGAIVHDFSEIDVQAIRKKLNMTQSVFAQTFGFSKSAVAHWEQGLRKPQKAARTLLKTIEFSPETVLKACHLA